ncbi:MAG: c-type cytochrome [Bacteriovoracaceae bacterium]|nr:c-type cytochrome [Bacteriovoracaceae bacterium]
MKTRYAIILAFLVSAFLAGAAGAMFIDVGIYDLAAIRPHNEVERKIIMFLKTNSIQYHARDLKAPGMNDPKRIRRGMKLFHKQCQVCHGAPGQDRDIVGVGLNPNPPPLVKASEHWSAEEIAWIIENGIKMAGMPAFGLGQSEQDIWDLSAFVTRLNTLSPEEYKHMLLALQDDALAEELQWVAPEQGWKKLKQVSNRKRGKRLLKRFGCTGCHIIPGIRSLNSYGGPPLTNWKKRHFIAGSVANNPINLVQWIRFPETINKGTMMPNLNVSERDAWDMANYLLSIEE